MSPEKIIAATKKKKYYIVKKEDLKKLLSHSIIVIEEDTHISDKIRLLKFKDEMLIQEKTNKDEFLVRIIKTRKEAEEFIKQRLDIYDRMWDGCGCRVEYYI
jgi:hypothetical protein